VATRASRLKDEAHYVTPLEAATEQGAMRLNSSLKAKGLLEKWPGGHQSMRAISAAVDGHWQRCDLKLSMND